MEAGEEEENDENHAQRAFAHKLRPSSQLDYGAHGTIIIEKKTKKKAKREAAAAAVGEGSKGASLRPLLLSSGLPPTHHYRVVILCASFLNEWKGKRRRIG